MACTSMMTQCSSTHMRWSHNVDCMYVCTQAWVSPWQVAHVLSILRTLQGDLAPAWQPAAARSRSLRPRRGSRLTYLTSTHLHIACTLDVPLISAIVMVGAARWRARSDVAPNDLIL